MACALGKRRSILLSYEGKKSVAARDAASVKYRRELEQIQAGRNCETRRGAAANVGESQLRPYSISSAERRVYGTPVAPSARFGHGPRLLCFIIIPGDNRNRRAERVCLPQGVMKGETQHWEFTPRTCESRCFTAPCGNRGGFS